MIPSKIRRALAALTIGGLAAVTPAAISAATATAAAPAVTAAAPAGFGWGAKPADTWT
jgi:hypothetical protein